MKELKVKWRRLNAMFYIAHKIGKSWFGVFNLLEENLMYLVYPI
jgi:hypothetical protein